MRTRESEIRTALFISGGGTTAEAVIKACRSGELRGIDPVVVISNRKDAGGLKKARRLGVPTRVIARFKEEPRGKYGERLLRVLDDLHVDLVSQNGWLPLTPENVVNEFQGRIINQHPGPLDPGRGKNMDFGGQGMIGSRVTCARLAYVSITGVEPYTEASTHFVTSEFDEGDLIEVTRLEISTLPNVVTVADLKTHQDEFETATSIVQSRLLPLEHQTVIRALQRFADGTASGWRRENPLIKHGTEDILTASRLASKIIFPNG